MHDVATAQRVDRERDLVGPTRSVNSQGVSRTGTARTRPRLDLVRTGGCSSDAQDSTPKNLDVFVVLNEIKRA